MIGAFDVLRDGIWTTVVITVGAFLLGAVLAVPLVALRRSPARPLRWVGRTLIEFLRSIPPLVWLFVAFYVIGSGRLQLSTLQASILGLGILAGAYLAEVYRAAIEAVPTGQFEASHALALGRWSTYVRVVLPQAVLLVIPPAATYAIGLLKDSAIASVVGATDVTFLAFQETRQSGSGFLPFVVAALIYLVLSIPVAVVARTSGTWIERRLAT